MATKRALTGGTGDVNMQFMGSYVAQGVINTYAENQIHLPRYLMGETKGKAVLIEILKVICVNPDMPVATTTPATASCLVGLATSSGDEDTMELDNTRMLLTWNVGTRHAFTAGGDIYTRFDQTKVFDLTDGAGHGILVAVEHLYHCLMTAGYTVVGHSHMKIFYRFKQVSTLEFIGILQSQGLR